MPTCCTNHENARSAASGLAGADGRDGVALPARPSLTRFRAAARRGLDLAAAAMGLLLLSPVFLAAALLVKLSSRGPILFRQERIGRRFRPFVIYKFRTMERDAPRRGGPITVGEDPRITPVGRFLRRTKLDELPQLVNVLRGDMSLVGPRPEVRRYVEMFRADFEEILQVRPGITDAASIAYRDEATLLAQAADPEEEYVRRVLPEKIALARQYVRRASLASDLALLLKTLWTLVSDRLALRRRSAAPSSGRSVTTPLPRAGEGQGVRGRRD